MQTTLRTCFTALTFALAATRVLAAPGCPAIPPRNPMPIEAMPQVVKIDEWSRREAQLTREVAGKDLGAVRLVFLGDSITQSWEPTMWNQFWGAQSPLNLGLWGDLTQGVLYRLNNGQWNPTLHPKLVVLLIGTNNANWKSRAEDTALGVAEIIRFIHRHSPATKVLLLGILPRGVDASTPERAVNAQVNHLIQRCADGQSVVYLDVGASMMDAEGRISNQVLFDYLHPTMVGYGILAGALNAQVRNMVTERIGNARLSPSNPGSGRSQ